VVSTYYEICFTGMLPGDALPGFERDTAGMDPPLTCLFGAVPDQWALSALVARLEELGVEVDEIRRIQGHDARSRQLGVRR
jgi:hypothetical protein